MRRLVWLFILSFQAFALAQDQRTESEEASTTVARLERPSAANPFLASLPQAQNLQGQGGPRSATAVPRPGMSGSSTGYVENAIIGSQVRLRLDVGLDVQSPDRVEFFYAKCGCYRELGVDPKAAGPAPALAGRNPATTKFIETDIDYRDFRMGLDYALNRRFSLFADLPIRSISPEVNADATGIGDFQAGVKLGLVATEETAVTFQFKAYFPTGDSRKGLGTDHSSIEPVLLLHHRLGERATFAAEFGDWHPIGGASAIPVSSSEDFSGDVLRYGFGLSYDLVDVPDGARLTPVFELVGWRILDGYASRTVDGTLSTFSLNSAEGTNIVNAKFGARLTVRGNHSVYVGYGLALTKAEWYGQIVRIEYRYAF